MITIVKWTQNINEKKRLTEPKQNNEKQLKNATESSRYINNESTFSRRQKAKKIS